MGYNALLHLSACCQESYEFYTKAAQKVNDPDLARMFYKMASARHKAIYELSQKFKNNIKNFSHEQAGEKPLTPALFNDVINYLEAHNLNDDFITHLEQIEDRFLDEFKKTLSEDLPHDIKISLLTYLVNLNDVNNELHNIRRKLHSLDPHL